MKRIKKIDGIPAKRITAYYDPVSDSIAINVQRVWEKHHCTDRFIKEYLKLYEHELIHRAICKLGEVGFSEYQEDYIVRRLLRQPFLKSEKRIYEKNNNKRKGNLGKSKTRV